VSSKNVTYLNKDFDQFRDSLIQFSKTYFPDTFQDFNESSPGMLFIEMASYVGDVLSFYTDETLKESLLQYATNRQSIYDIARSRGYRVNNIYPSVVDLDVYQLVPAIGSGDDVRPDYSYAINIDANSTVISNQNSSVSFRTTDIVDFSYSSSYNPTEVTVYEVDDVTNEPLFYTLKKKVRALSGEIRTATLTFGSAIQYVKETISDTNIISIVDVVDNDGNKWYEVPYLAQSTIMESVQNVSQNNPQLSIYRNSGTPYLLNFKKVSRRFITYFNSRGDLEIQFGSGISELDDENIIPNPDMIGSQLYSVDKNGDIDVDPSNFIYTKTYGLVPSNTTLTVRYTVGGGVSDNIPSDTLQVKGNIGITIDETQLNQTILNVVKRSISFNNPLPATGGKDVDSLDEIRNKAIANFSTQNRAVTLEDYAIRAYSMPSIYGSIAKVHVLSGNSFGDIGEDDPQYRFNPLNIDLYVLGYDNNKRLTKLNEATIDNLKKYIGYYKIISDNISIKHAYIINIGIEFKIITLPDYNSYEVIASCISKLKNTFDIDKWNINQPISINNLYVMLDRVEGVQTVSEVKVINLYDTTLGYSGNWYDIETATKDGIIYPSLDPSIFEIKYPNTDIKGRVVG